MKPVLALTIEAGVAIAVATAVEVVDQEEDSSRGDTSIFYLSMVSSDSITSSKVINLILNI